MPDELPKYTLASPPGGNPSPPRIGPDLSKLTLQRYSREFRVRQLKKFVLTLIFAGLAFASGTQLHSALTSGSLFDWLIFVSIFFAYLAMFGLAALVFSWQATAVFSTLAVALFTFPVWGKSVGVAPLAGAILAGATLQFIGGIAMRRQMTEGVKFSFGPSFRAGSGYVFTAFALLVTLVYYFAFAATGGKHFFVSEKTLGSFLAATQYLGQAYALRSDMSIDEVLGVWIKASRNETAKLLRQNPSMTGLPDEEFNRMLIEIEKQSVITARKNIAALTGENLNGKEKATTVIYDYLDKKYSGLEGNAQKLLKGSWFASIFALVLITFRSLAWLANIWGWLMLQIFLPLRLVGIVRIPAERQNLQIP